MPQSNNANSPAPHRPQPDVWSTREDSRDSTSSLDDVPPAFRDFHRVTDAQRARALLDYAADRPDDNTPPLTREGAFRVDMPQDGQLQLVFEEGRLECVRRPFDNEVGLHECPAGLGVPTGQDGSAPPARSSAAGSQEPQSPLEMVNAVIARFLGCCDALTVHIKDVVAHGEEAVEILKPTWRGEQARRAIIAQQIVTDAKHLRFLLGQTANTLLTLTGNKLETDM